MKFILSSIVFLCLLFTEGRALQFSILFPSIISLGKEKVMKMFLTANETTMIVISSIILHFFFTDLFKDICDRTEIKTESELAESGSSNLGEKLI